MDDKLSLLRRFFSNKYSRNDYLVLKNLLLANDSDIELLMRSHWDEFITEESPTKKDLSQILAILNREIDRKSKIRILKKIFHTYSRVAAILVLPLLLALGFFYLEFNQYLYQKPVFVDVSSPAGLRTSLNLPDGSIVWLNGESRIRYPAVFNENREVEVEGEAFFKVKSDKKNPFLVATKNITVKATGTEFNVKAYNDDPEVRVILKVGNIAVLDDKHSVLKEMDAGNQLSYSKKSSSITYTVINSTNYTDWINGKLVFSHATLAEVVDRLERWYGVNIEIKDKELLQLHFKATFIDENLEEALKLLQSTAVFDFYIAKREVRTDGSFEKRSIYIIKKQ